MCDCDYLLEQIALLREDLDSLIARFDEFLFDDDAYESNIFDLIESMENMRFEI